LIKSNAARFSIDGNLDPRAVNLIDVAVAVAAYTYRQAFGLGVPLLLHKLMRQVLCLTFANPRSAGTCQNGNGSSYA